MSGSVIKLGFLWGRLQGLGWLKSGGQVSGAVSGAVSSEGFVVVVKSQVVKGKGRGWLRGESRSDWGESRREGWLLHGVRSGLQSGASSCLLTQRMRVA